MDFRMTSKGQLQIKAPSRFLGMCVLFACQIVFASQLAEKAAAQTPGSNLDAQYIPRDAIGIISVWPQVVAAHKDFQLYPLEIVSAAGIEQVGIDPLKIERIDAVIGMPGPMGPVVAAMITMSNPIDVNGLKPELFDGDWLDDRGFRMRRMAGDPNIVLHVIDDTHAIIGTTHYVRQMAQKQNQLGALSGVHSKFKSAQAALAVVTFDTVRPMIEGFLDAGRNQMPPQIIDDVSTLASSVQYIAIRANLGVGTKTQLLVAGSDAAAGEKIEASLKRLMTFGVSMAKAQAAQNIDGNSPTDRAALAYADRLSNEIVKLLTPRRSNERLLVELDNNTSLATVGTSGVLVGLLLPAVQAAREAARRMQSSNNLKQIMLAMHNYHEVNKSFPAPVIRSADGQPLLSWRVSILPYIEEGNLYNEFHLDEPWDSPHNMRLVERMPATYRHPSSAALPGQTIYMAVVGDLFGFRKDGATKMSEIIDGTSNTIAVVEVDDQAAKPWTAPEDFEPLADSPLDNLRSMPSRGFNAGFFDGSVQFMSSGVDPKLLWSLFTRSGGEPVTLP